MTDYTKILDEAKNSEDETLMHFVVLTIILILTDISHLWAHFNYPNWLRPIYTILFLCCYYVLINRYYRRKRIKRETEELRKNEQIIYQAKINNYLKNVKPALDNLDGLEQMVLRKFIEEKELVTVLLPTPLNQVPMNQITSINQKLCMLGLNIKVITPYPHLVVEIDQIFYDVLKIYFNK